MRFAVRPQMREFREALDLPVQCSESSVGIIDHKDLHIDHKVPFWVLLEHFSQDFQVDLSALRTEGNGETLELIDREVANAFYQYHRHNAELQPTLKAVNVAKGGRITSRKSLRGSKADCLGNIPPGDTVAEAHQLLEKIHT